MNPQYSQKTNHRELRHKSKELWVKLALRELNFWFEKEGRSLPWRGYPDPYAVWVSEVMLQQTQVRTVIPYFRKWMERWPTIEMLAKAPIEEVVKVWEGLGYYSRARALKKGAEIVMEKFEGTLPETREELLQIPGIGPYTAAAILSFAFKQRSLALDGNVLRVLSRYFADEGDITKEATKKRLGEKGERLLDAKEPWKSAEAFIELGALICTKGEPKCERCPLQKGCKALAGGRVHDFPKRPPRSQVTTLKRGVLVARYLGTFLVCRNEGPGLMEGLFEFPFVEHEGDAEAAVLALAAPFGILEVSPLSLQTHSFTRFRAELTPFLIEVAAAPCGLWLDLDALKERPFSSGHKRILQELTLSARLQI